MDDQDADNAIWRGMARATESAEADEARWAKAVHDTFALLAASHKCLAESHELMRQVSIDPWAG
jgi:hypothetical protein